MILRRYIHYVKRKKFCKFYCMALYFTSVCLGYICWQMSQNLTKEEYTPLEEANRLFVLPPSEVISQFSGIHVVSAFFDDRTTLTMSVVLRLLVLSNDRKLSLHCCVQLLDSKSWMCSTTAVQVKILASNSPKISGRVTYEAMYTCHGFPKSLFEQRPIRGILVDPTKGQYTKRSVIADFTITYNVPLSVHRPNGSFAVCIHPKKSKQSLSKDGQDIVEFAELSKLLGASRLISYHSNHAMDYIPDYSIKSGVSLTKVQWTTPFGGQNLYRTLAMNDCLYRSMANGDDYLVFLDINEMLVPNSNNDWFSLTNTLRGIHNSSAVGSYNFNVFSFYDETTNRTSSYIGLHGHLKMRKRHLPRTVRYRLRETVSTTDLIPVIEPTKVDHITASGTSKMLPGFSLINVPVEFGTVHRFVEGHKRLKDLVVDSSKDKFVPGLIRALHVLGYHTDIH